MARMNSPTEALKIASQFFSPALSTQAVTAHAQGLGMYDNGTGSVASGIDDINQSIHIIVTTPLGSDPHRPTFGCGQFNYIDAPINVAKPHIVREVTDALRQWEPRVVIVRVLVTLSDIAALDCAIYWRFADGVAADTYVTNLSLGGVRGQYE